MKKKIFYRYFFLILAFVTMVYIFVMSAQTAEVSSRSSGSVIELFAKFLVKDFENSSAEFKLSIIIAYQKIIRTAAHFTVFSCLGFSVCGHLMTYKFPTKKSINLFSFLFCFLYAISDEIHQLFVIGRSCQLVDIVVDVFGALFGIIVLNLFYLFFKRVRLFFIRKAVT